MALPRPPPHARRHARRHTCPLDLGHSPRSLPPPATYCTTGWPRRRLPPPQPHGHAPLPHREAAIRQVLYHPARTTPDGPGPRPLPAPVSRRHQPSHPAATSTANRYHGVLAPNARLRERVVALGRDDGEVPTDAATSAQADATPHAAGATEVERSAPDRPASPQRTAAGSRWARLLARIYEVFPLLCPHCGAEMPILAFITAAEPIDAILRHLGLPATPPPLSPARGPPRHHLGFDADPGLDIDQTPAFDPTKAEPAPDFDFDQSRGA